MSDEEEHPGLEALLECSDQVQITIRVYMPEITKFLRKSKIIDLSLYSEVNDPQNRNPPHTKATLVYQRLQAMVQQDEKKYYGIFVDYLRKNSKYEKTVSMLDKAYADNGGNVNANGSLPNPPETVVPKPAPAATAYDSPAMVSAPKKFVLDVPEVLPDKFSEGFSPLQFAEWMKGKKFLPDEDCEVIIDCSISGLVFMELDEPGLKEYGFVRSGFYALRGVLKEVAKTKPVSVVVPVPTEVTPSEEEESVASDGFNREKEARFPATDRGIYSPQLKFESGDQIAKLKPKNELKIPPLTSGYYPMQSKKHGVCLIINNKTFKDPNHRERKGTDRDEYNLIETWRYLGYHVEVRREAKHQEITDIFYDIDKMLDKINRKMKSQVTNDSFVCCILSHGNNFCIYSSDSKEVKIDYLERALGASAVLQDKPKIFFIQACQGEELGTMQVTSKLHTDMSGLQADGEIHTSGRSDIYICYATAQGDQSYRHTEKGSWFIGAVCRTLCKESKQCSLNELQKLINTGVADDVDNVLETAVGVYRQQPSCGDQLRRNVHFFFESAS